MKNKTGTIIGFILGVAGFLFLFKIIFLNRISPEDELAPGIVMFIAIMNGCLLAFAGYRIQNALGKKRNQFLGRFFY